MRKLTKVGDVVLDPFMGSGTVAVVSERLGREWRGFEIDEEYVRIMEERMNRGILPVL